LLKANPNERIVIPLAIDINEPVKSLFKHLTKYFRENLEREGFHYIKNSTKLNLSELNHQMFMCNDPDIFESVYLDPLELIKMI